MKLSRKPPSSLLGLTFDGNRLEGVLVRRKNGSVVAQKNFAVTLALDPLTNDPELVGREIKNQLEAAGIRERRVAVNVPLNWILTISTKLPDLAEGDVQSFLQIEAERGFPYGLESLLISSSRYRTAAGDQYATQAAVPKDHILRLEKALHAARLNPVTFAVGIAALQSATGGAGGILALEVGEKAVALEVLCDGGIAALRLLEETVETEAGQRILYSDVITRESRITLVSCQPRCGIRSAWYGFLATLSWFNNLPTMHARALMRWGCASNRCKVILPPILMCKPSPVRLCPPH